MALDHTREFLTNSALNSLDPAKTNLAMYFTRWVTHLCAPVFVFLAGTAIYLQRPRYSTSQLSQRVLLRGCWLVVLELTAVNLIFNFNWHWNVQLLEVIWAIGVSMMIMALFVRLSLRWSVFFGLATVITHNAFDKVSKSTWGSADWIWQLLHVPGMITSPLFSSALVVVAYPLVPWVGVMALGYSFGFIATKRMADVRRVLLYGGLSMLGIFVVLRWTNAYGDPQKWTHQAHAWRTVLSFMNVQKYPPSLLFLLVTLGLAAVVMAVLIHAEESGTLEWIRGHLEVFGRVPLFYFLLHITCIHAIALALSIVSGSDWRWWITSFPAGGVLRGRPPGFGFGLPIIWCVWIAVVVACYPVCKWYAGLKSRKRSPLLSYL
jgi:uncharacterized membrane protein